MAGEAFAESAILTHGLIWKLVCVLFGVMLFSFILGLVALLFGDACASVVLAVLGRYGVVSLAVSFGALLLLRTVIGAGCTFLSSCVDAGVFTLLYRRRLAALAEASFPGRTGAEAVRNAPPGWLPAVLVCGLVAFAATTTWLAIDGIPDERPATIHAHRGVWTTAPENTLAAAREAIAAGADYLETDVQYPAPRLEGA
jgi:hypothetical protein